ncbi:hypothetical protein D3C76_663510 [compost metagenome]
MHIGFDVGFAVQLAAHGLEGVAEPVQLRAVEARQAGGLTLADRIGIVHQLADGAGEPPHQQGADQQRDEQQQGRPLQQLVLAALYHGQQGAVGLGDGEGTQDLVPLAQGGGHVHHRAGGIVGIAAGAAGAILPAQGAVDVVPAGIVLAQIHPVRVIDHLAFSVDHIDAVLRLLLEVTVDQGIDGALVEAGEGAGQPAIRHPPLLQIVQGQGGQQLGHVHQGILGGAAHPGFDLLDEDLQHEPGGQGEDEHQAAQQLQSDSHLIPRPVPGTPEFMPAPGCSPARGGSGSDWPRSPAPAAWRAGS